MLFPETGGQEERMWNTVGGYEKMKKMAGREQLFAQTHSALLLWEYFRSLHSLAQKKPMPSKNTAEVETQTLQWTKALGKLSFMKTLGPTWSPIIQHCLSQSHRITEVGVYLWRSPILIKAWVAKAGFPRFPGLCPDRLSGSPEMEIPQLLWVTCASIRALSQ